MVPIRLPELSRSLLGRRCKLPHFRLFAGAFSHPREVAHFERPLRYSAGSPGGRPLVQPSRSAGVPGGVTLMGPSCKTKPEPSIDFALSGAPLGSIFVHFWPLRLELAPAEAQTRHARLG